MYVIFMEKSKSGKGCPGRTKFVRGKEGIYVCQIRKIHGLKAEIYSRGYFGLVRAYTVRVKCLQVGRCCHCNKNMPE
jgi:hypothetical protein